MSDEAKADEPKEPELNNVVSIFSRYNKKKLTEPELSEIERSLKLSLIKLLQGALETGALRSVASQLEDMMKLHLSQTEDERLKRVIQDSYLMSMLLAARTLLILTEEEQNAKV